MPKTMINVILTFFSLASFFLAPELYNIFFNQMITIAFLAQAIPFVIKKSKENIINFYSLFYFSYFFINFFYAAVIYPIDSEYFSVFTLPFNEYIINKSTAIAWISSSFFILGANKKVSLKNILKKNSNIFAYKHDKSTIFTGILVLSFVLTVGKEFLSGNFVGQSALSLYILQLVTCSFIVTTVIFFRDYYKQKNKYWFFTIALLYIILFLGIGDRGPALSLLVVCIALYSQYVNKIKLRLAVPIALLGVVLMHIIGEGRSASMVESGGNILSRGTENFEFSIDSLYDLTQGLVVNSYTLYLGVDYVEDNGLNLGITFLKPLISVFPFIQTLLVSITNVELQTSSEFFTEEVLGTNPTWGVGTNLVADVYISFGLVGCVILFYFFGRFIEISRLNMLYKNTITTNIIYFSMVSLAIYMPRTGLLTPLKFIVWSLVIYIFLRFIKFIRSMSLRNYE